MKRLYTSCEQPFIQFAWKQLALLVATSPVSSKQQCLGIFPRLSSSNFPLFAQILRDPDGGAVPYNSRLWRKTSRTLQSHRNIRLLWKSLQPNPGSSLFALWSYLFFDVFSLNFPPHDSKEISTKVLNFWENENCSVNKIKHITHLRTKSFDVKTLVVQKVTFFWHFQVIFGNFSFWTLLSKNGQTSHKLNFSVVNFYVRTSIFLA